MPDTLAPQVPVLLEVLAAAGIATAGAEGYEADDVIGTLAAAERTDPVLAVSGDRDLMQIVRDEPVPVRLLYVGRGLAKAEHARAGRGGREVRGAGERGPARPTPRWRCCAATRPTGCPACPGSAPRPRPRSSAGSTRGPSCARPCIDRGRHPADPAGPQPSWPPPRRYLAVVEPVVRVAVDAPVQLDRPDTLPAEPADPTDWPRWRSAGG